MVVAVGVMELMGSPWSAPHGPVHRAALSHSEVCPHWRKGAVRLDSLFLLTFSKHSLLGNEMQIDRKDNEPACGPVGQLVESG